MNSYKTVRSSAEAVHVVERSKFIAHIARVESREQAEAMISKIKKEYWDARHNVYAYVLKNGESRCSDDGEPSGTSGMPTLDVLLKQGFSDVCVVTTRYFGGILLGTGGLVRAYSKAAALALEAAGSVEVAECVVARLDVPYAQAERVQRFLKEHDCVAEQVEYAEIVHFTIHYKARRKDEITLALTDKFGGEIMQAFYENAFKEL